MNNSNEIGPLKALAIMVVIAAFMVTPVLIYSSQKIKHYDEAATAFFDPGSTAYQQGHYAEAEADLRQFLDAVPYSTKAKYDLGLCTLAQGKRADARFWFRAAEAGWSWENEGKRRSYCGGQLCQDMAEEMLTWMDHNPTWAASQTTPMPPLLKVVKSD